MADMGFKIDLGFHRWVFLAVMVFGLGLVGESWADNRVLRFNWPSQRDPDTVLKEIVLTDDQIIITVEHRNRGLLPTHPRLFPPGHALSFYIREKDTGKRHYLAASQGLAVEPDYNVVLFGQKRTFKLFFPKIPLTTFEVLEGEPGLRGSVGNAIFWDFLNIDLARLDKDFKVLDKPPPRPDHVWSSPQPPVSKSSDPPVPSEPAKPKAVMKEVDKAKTDRETPGKQEWKVFTDSKE